MLAEEPKIATWVRGMGSLNVANIDNDPELECTFMSGSSLNAIDRDMQPEWTVDSNGDPVNGNHEDFWESTSGVTGTAVFDFDGDGASEVISSRPSRSLYCERSEWQGPQQSVHEPDQVVALRPTLSILSLLT